MSTLIKLLSLISKEARWRLATVAGLGVIVAVLELAFTLTLIQIVATLTNQEAILSSIAHLSIYSVLGLNMTIGILRGLIALGLTNLHAKTIHDCEISSWIALLRNYLHGSYAQMKTKGLPEMTRLVTYDTNESFEIYLHSWLIIVTESFVFICLASLLLYSNLQATTLVFASGLMLFIIIGKLFGKRSRTLGNQYYEVSHLNQNRIMETLEGHLQIRTSQRESFFLNRVRETSLRFGQISSNIRWLNEWPKIILDSSLSGIIAISVIWIGAKEFNSSAQWTFVTAFLISGLRLFPSIARISTALNNVAYYRRTCQRFIEDYEALKPRQEKDSALSNSVLTFQSLELGNISYSYGSGEAVCLFRNLSLKLKAGDWLLVQGPSGCGKSTLLEIMTGLLVPRSGEVFLNGQLVNYSIEVGWSNLISYCPQSPLILDASVSENIRFGMHPDELPDQEIVNLLNLVGLKDRVFSEPSKLNWNVGPRGSRLSGGERQRLVLARALGMNRPILFLDESTSALDAESEIQIFNSIQERWPDITLLWVSHSPRLTLSRFKKFDLGVPNVEGNSLGKG